MEIAKRFVVLIVVLLMAAGAQSAEGPAKISNTRTASCLVKITSDPAVLPLSFESIAYLLASSGVGGKAVREVLDVSPDQAGDFFTVRDMGTITYMGSLSPSGMTLPTPPRMASPGVDGPGLNADSTQQQQSMELRSSDMQAPAAPGAPSVPRPAIPAVQPRLSRTRTTEPTSRRVVTAVPPAAEQTQRFGLIIQLPDDAKPAAEEFMDALIFHLRNALTNAFDEHAGRLRGQLQLAEEEAARAEGDLRQKQDQLREISGSYVLDRGNILLEISRLRSQIQEIEMRHASGQVSVDTTAKRIAELQAKVQSEIEKDSITEELKRLLALQDASFQNAEKLSASGRISSAELSDAQEKVARSRIELAQRREQLNKSKGGSQIEFLTNALTNRSEEIAQYRAQIAGYEQQLAQAEALLAKADDYELLSLKADIAKQGLQETLVWRDRLSRQIRMLQPPSVSVIGGQ
jgi:hypothetical protein